MARDSSFRRRHLRQSAKRKVTSTSAKRASPRSGSASSGTLGSEMGDVKETHNDGGTARDTVALIDADATDPQDLVVENSNAAHAIPAHEADPIDATVIAATTEGDSAEASDEHSNEPTQQHPDSTTSLQALDSTVGDTLDNEIQSAIDEICSEYVSSEPASHEQTVATGEGYRTAHSTTPASLELCKELASTSTVVDDEASSAPLGSLLDRQETIRPGRTLRSQSQVSLAPKSPATITYAASSSPSDRKAGLISTSALAAGKPLTYSHLSPARKLGAVRASPDVAGHRLRNLSVTRSEVEMTQKVPAWYAATACRSTPPNKSSRAQDLIRLFEQNGAPSSADKSGSSRSPWRVQPARSPSASVDTSKSFMLSPLGKTKQDATLSRLPSALLPTSSAGNDTLSTATSSVSAQSSGAKGSGAHKANNSPSPTCNQNICASREKTGRSDCNLTPEERKVQLFESLRKNSDSELDTTSEPHDHLSPLPATKAASKSSSTLGTRASFRQKRDIANVRTDTEATLASIGKTQIKPLKTGSVYYFNVHLPQPIWQLTQVVLLPGAVALSWAPPSGGRVSVMLDLKACRQVHSETSLDLRDDKDDLAATTARNQGLTRICPWRLVFDDGIERMAVESASDRVQWVSTIWDALGCSASRKLFDSASENQLNSARAMPSTPVSAPLHPAEDMSAIDPEVIMSHRSVVRAAVDVEASKTGETARTRGSITKSQIGSSPQSSDRASSKLTAPWSPLDKREISPDDSASQQPARMISNGTSIPSIAFPCQEELDSRVRDIRPSRLLQETHKDGNKPAPASRRTSKSKCQLYGTSPSSARDTCTGNISALDVQKLLDALERQAQEHLWREERFEERVRNMQETLETVIKEKDDLSKSKASRSSRRSSAATSAKTAAIVAADAAALGVMQSKLDQVLSLVNKVSQGQAILERRDSSTTRGPQAPSERSSSDLARIEKTLQALMSSMQRNRPVSTLARESTNRKRSQTSIKSLRRCSAPATIDLPRPVQDNPLSSQVMPTSSSAMSSSRSWQSSETLLSVPANTLASDEYGAPTTSRLCCLSMVSLDRKTVGADDDDTVRAASYEEEAWPSSVASSPRKTSSRPAPAEVSLLLEAIRETEEERKAQRKQQEDIARYLNELNGWLEKDVSERNEEWRALSLGVSKLHEELAIMKGEAVNGAAVSEKPNIDGEFVLRDSKTLSNAQHEADIDATARAMDGAQSVGDSMSIADSITTSDAAEMDANVASPIVTPGPAAPIKRSGTRTWRARDSPAPLRNDDVWSGSGTVKTKAERKEEKKAADRARRRDSLSGVGRIAAAAGGAALVAAATHEYDKYRERQRGQGRPEDHSAEVNAETGSYVKHDEVPDEYVEKIVKAAKEGDESQVRDVIREAAEAGAGPPAIKRFIDEIKDKASSIVHPRASTKSKDDTDGDTDGEEDETVTVSAKKVARSDGDTDSLRSAVNTLEAGATGGALALAVEEILKHLIERKEEEKRKKDAEEQAERLREAARRQEEIEREERLNTLRDREKNELVETIIAKLQAETARQQAEEQAKQREMDPKSAIESLVGAINAQRQADAVQKASADEAVRQMASDLVKTTSEQNGQLVEAVHGAAREMLRHNVEVHADELKRILGKEVTAMFEDVGKIREAKRALELEMSDLFQIKSKHLQGLDELKAAISSSAEATAAASTTTTVKELSRGPLPSPAPSTIPVPANFNLPQQVSPHSMPRSLPPMPMPQPTSMEPISIPPMPMPDFPSSIPVPGPSVMMGAPGPGTAPMPPPRVRRDFVAPFSINFGPRTR